MAPQISAERTQAGGELPGQPGPNFEIRIPSNWRRAGYGVSKSDKAELGAYPCRALGMEKSASGAPHSQGHAF